MDCLMVTIDEEDMRNKIKHDLVFGSEEDEGDHQELGFQESTKMLIKKEDEEMEKKNNQDFGIESVDEGDHQEGGFQETTKMIMINKKGDDETKKNYDQGFLDQGRRFQETTNIKKRLRVENDDEDTNCLDKKKKQKKKKKKVISLRCLEYPTPMPPDQDLPIKFRKRITALGGSDIALVIHKCLFKTDVSPGHNRLSIPLNQIIHNDFLTPQETDMLNHSGHGNNQKRLCPEIEVMLIEPSLHRDTISLRKWDMKKPSGNSTSMYVLAGKWNSVAWRNVLREDETVQLWSFRINSKLCFALVKRRARSGCFLFGSSSATSHE